MESGSNELSDLFDPNILEIKRVTDPAWSRNADSFPTIRPKLMYQPVHHLEGKGRQRLTDGFVRAGWTPVITDGQKLYNLPIESFLRMVKFDAVLQEKRDVDEPLY